MTLFFADGTKKVLQKAEKEQIADGILDEALHLLQRKA